MEDLEQKSSDNPSYWASVIISGVIFGIILFAIGLIAGYATINSEPTGAIFTPSQLIGTVACLFGAFGGMLATWHYAKEHDIAIQLGKGALIGFLTGVIITFINILLTKGWAFIDPDMTQKVIDSTVANVEAMEMPAEQKQMTIDMTVESLRSGQSIWSQLLWGIPMYGILNLITGVIGAKIFGNKEDEF